MNGFRGQISEKNKLFSAIMNGVVEMGFDNSDNNIDVFGDIYEYLMHMYAENGGKKGGEFYTPQEVSELLAKLTLLNNPNPLSVYDPTCGSGSLLLKFKKVYKNPPLKYYGQEKDPTTHNLSRMNMFLKEQGLNDLIKLHEQSEALNPQIISAIQNATQGQFFLKFPTPQNISSK